MRLLFTKILMIFWVIQEIVTDDSLCSIFAEIKRIIRQNGKLMIVENIFSNERKKLTDSNIGTLFEDSKGNKIRLFEENSLAHIMRKYGFKLLQKENKGWSFFECYMLE